MAKILVVDDIMIMRQVITNYLQKLGHDVVSEATNLDRALQQYKRYCNNGYYNAGKKKY